jgi:hypothetical protein
MIRAPRGRPPNRERHRHVAELRRRGWTLRAIGRRLGISYQRVVVILRTSGLPSDLPPVRCATCGAEVGLRRRAGVPVGRVRSAVAGRGLERKRKTPGVIDPGAGASSRIGPAVIQDRPPVAAPT